MGDESGEAAVKIEMSDGLQLKEADEMAHKRDHCAPERHCGMVQPGWSKRYLEFGKQS